MDSIAAWDRERLRAACAKLAAQGVFLGTSSWKYPGWRGQLYTDDRYIWRGRFSESRFERLCLAEYQEVFKTVGVDGSYYTFPDAESLGELISGAPPDFLFTFKVTDEITLKRFRNLPRFAGRAGQWNPNFLNSEVFVNRFLEPCAPFRKNIGVLLFEFSHFYPADFRRGRDFVKALDHFLGQLPSGWRYGVEIRNLHFLHPEYFAMLARHGVAHVFNSWTRMPPLLEQLDMPGSITTGEFLAARFLLKPGRPYAEAVRLFRPYQAVRELNAEGRAAGARLIRQTASGSGAKQAFVYVNNRFEGNAPATICAMIEQAERGS
ncbi:MAG: DUF72 domain-containing protein [Verrucomicrobiota bacterium]